MARYDKDYENFNHPALNYEPPRVLKMIRAGGILALSVIVVVGGWGLYWFTMASVLQDSARAWIAQEHAQGAEVGYDVWNVSGFPTRIQLDLKAPHWQGKMGTATVRLGAESLTVSQPAWAPWQTQASVSGVLSMRLDGQTFQGKAQTFSIDLTPDTPWPKTLTANIQGLDLKAQNGERIAVQTAKVWLTSAINATADKDALRIVVHASGLEAPARFATPLGRRMERVTAELGLSGPVRFLESGAIDWTAWREADGTLQVRNLDVLHEGFSLTGKGRFVLDENDQPKGALSAKLGGLFGTLDRLRQLGLVKDSDVVGAKFALAGLMRKGPSGSTLAAQVGVEAGEVFIGPIKIGAYESWLK